MTDQEYLPTDEKNHYHRTPFTPGFNYKTKSGHQAKVLHSCTGCIPALVGFITLSDGDEVPATWNPQGESYRRDAGYRGTASEFDLLPATQSFTKDV